MDSYAVMGKPISHSLSPFIHQEFATQTQQTLSYTPIEVEVDHFPAAVSEFFSQGGKGLNITVPFKQEAWALAESRSDFAELAGAVNTLFINSDGQLEGHNTDGLGLLRDIKENYGGSLSGKDILVLGAGGATRGILLPLLKENPKSLLIANRTLAKAQELVSLFGNHDQLKACALSNLDPSIGTANMKVDWLINASSASLQGELPLLSKALLKPGAYCYDLMYGKEDTIFCRWAKQAGAEIAIDGLGMLVEQAAESFYLWRGIRPNTAPIMQALRKL